MDKIIKKIKDFYDTYKIIIWIAPLFGGALYDRFVNMWNVSGRLDYDEVRFIETRKRDSIMYANHLIEEKSEIIALRKEINDSKGKLPIIKSIRKFKLK